MLEKLIRSKAGVKLLGVVLFTDGLHLRELARKADISSFEAKRELDVLVDLGILIRKKVGNQVFFYTDKNCPFLIDLKNLYQKTEGFIFVLKENLSSLNIKFAFIFGSTAKGTEKSTSDIDLLIISDENDSDLSKIIFKIQKQLKKEINFILWSEKDFKEKLKSKNTFLDNIIYQKLWITGDEDEFSRIIKEGFGKKNRAR